MGRGQGSGTVAPSFPAGVRTLLLTVEGRSGRPLTLRLSRPSAGTPLEVVFDGAGGGLLVPPHWRPAFAELSVRHRGEWTLRLRETVDGPPRDAVPGPPADERLDAFRVPDGAYAGRGEDSAVFARPERGRAAVLEFGFDELVERRPVAVLIEGPRGDRRTDFRLITALSPQRVLLWHTDDTANLPALRVRAGAEGPWWARLLDLDHLPRLVDRTEGEGHDVLRYDGPPALLSFTLPRDNDHLLVGSWGGAHGVRLCHSPYADRTGSDLIGAGQGAELIDVRSGGRWEARVEPVAGARAFGDAATGRGPEILRWTGRSGRTGRLALVNLASGNDPGSVTADSLTEDLRRLGSTSAFPQDGGRPAALHTRLSPGCLIRVADSSFSGWRLQVD
ncbi:hypothetical protein [Kitasatospora sp. NPDC059327]|uniref:hypothetical protein n=1 Tax=Kitasatospora sp. NPDC059327 TaxID=3346803 RepID=UPI0036B86E91